MHDAFRAGDLDVVAEVTARLHAHEESVRWKTSARMGLSRNRVTAAARPRHW
ncbi:hypothetical protein [Streptomyces sp. NPDC054838]